MDVQEERRYIVAHIESYELQIRLIEEQLAQLRRMNPRARGVASGIVRDERTLEGHRAGLAARRARLAELDGVPVDGSDPELDEAEARAQAAHQAAKDRDREPDRWPTGRPAWPPAPGSPAYLAADARWRAHLAERTAGAGADDLADLIDR